MCTSIMQLRLFKIDEFSVEECNVTLGGPKILF